MEWNCSEWRCLSPSSAINASGKHQAKLLYLPSFVSFGDAAIQDIVGTADVIVVQRNMIQPEVWDAVDYWRGLHKTVVIDLDDDYPDLPWSNPAHAFWIQNTVNAPVPPIELLTEGMRHCDALISPSKVILDDWKDVLPGLWMPNYATGAWYKGIEYIRRQKDKSKIVIGWGGSVSHYDAWWFSGAKEALEELCRERKNVIIKICGNDPRLFDLLDVPEGQKIRQLGVPPEEWPKVMVTFDIGIAPLDLREGDKSYDNRRSWLKGLEYMLTGVPWVASNGKPYADLAKYGTMTENTKADWKAALENIIDHMSEARQEAAHHRNVAWNLTLEANVDKMIEVYERAQMLRNSVPTLPNVWRVKHDDKKTVPVPSPFAPKLEVTGHAKDKRAVQRASFAAAQAWHKDWGILCDGVPLGESMRYDIIQQLNVALLEE